MRSREIAGAAGVTVKTHYHRIGLLPEPPRSENGYRDYRVEDLVLLLRIRRFADLGFSLGAISSLIAEEGRADCALARLEADLAEALTVYASPVEIIARATRAGTSPRLSPTTFWPCSASGRARGFCPWRETSCC